MCLSVFAITSKVISGSSSIFQVNTPPPKLNLVYDEKYDINYRVKNLKFATYLKFATCENTTKINELW